MSDRREVERLLADWRAFKSSVLTWALRMAIALLLIGLAVRLRLEDMIR